MRSSRWRVALAVAGVLGTTTLAAEAAGAQVPTAPCPAAFGAPPGALCGLLTVPMDHTGRIAGVQRLTFARVPARGGVSRGTIAVLPGGPGEAALPLGRVIARALRPALADHDLLLVDPRGTGRSDPTRCSVRALASTPAGLRAVAACAARLGARRETLTTAEEVRDLEDVRTALAIPRLTVLGVSYGTKVAGEYARRFPASTDHVVLDSVVPPDGLDAASELPTFALPRVLREVCWPPGCAGISRGADPRQTLGALVARLQRRPLNGRFVDPRGVRRPVPITTALLYRLVTTSDTDPFLRADLPAAIRSALAGDAAPLARLLAQGIGAARAAQEQTPTEDAGRFLATLCAESRLPWRADAPLAGRRAALLARVTAQAERYAPFPPRLVAALSPASACVAWPPTTPPADAGGVAPPVPTLILEGREDLRTPVEDARRTAALYPNARLLNVPDAGHSVLTSGAGTCAARALVAFLADRPVAACPRGDRALLDVAPFIPAQIARLPRAPGVPAGPGGP
jgi:pimeloyl-ACP methyl ester carboxylesterase